MSGMTEQDARTIGKALQQPGASAKRLPALPARGGIPSATATGMATQTASPASGGEIDSPLTEQSRTYYPQQYITTSDGLFVIGYMPVQSVTMKDASKRVVVFNYSKPEA